VLIVHLRRNRIKLKEIEIMAIAGINETNSDTLLALIESYRQMIFPGTSEESEKDTEMEERKAALAREAEKAFIVRPIDLKEVMGKQIKNPNYKKLVGKAIYEEDKKRRRDMTRLAKAELSTEARRAHLKREAELRTKK